MVVDSVIPEPTARIDSENRMRAGVPMIVQCADCKTRYELDASRVPNREIRVRCPKCRAVFGIDGQRAAAAPQMAAAAPAANRAPTPPQPQAAQAAPVAAPIEPTPVAQAPVEPTPVAQAPSGGSDIQIERNGLAGAAPVAEQTAPPIEMDFEIERSAGPAMSQGRPAAGVGAPVEPAVNAATAVADAPSKAKAKPADDKAKRLARALVSDILVYHRDARDQALSDGNLVQVLGQEIKKSWELYKERVTPEVANETNYFREALNEILADGQQIF
jgi:predicted Zn finger-like uncharacterized protein